MNITAEVQQSYPDLCPSLGAALLPRQFENRLLKQSCIEEVCRASQASKSYQAIGLAK